MRSKHPFLLSPTKNSETTLSSHSLTDTLSYDEGAISPLSGIVVRPLENVSVYGNFTSGLTRGGTAPVGTANVGEVTPGLRLMASATFYDAKLQRTAGGVNLGKNVTFRANVENLFNKDYWLSSSTLLNVGMSTCM